MLLLEPNRGLQRAGHRGRTSLRDLACGAFVDRWRDEGCVARAAISSWFNHHRLLEVNEASRPSSGNRPTTVNTGRPCCGVVR